MRSRPRVINVFLSSTSLTVGLIKPIEMNISIVLTKVIASSQKLMTVSH